MTRINTNISSLTAQHSLRKSNDSLQTALTRLSTGLRINSGKDDPAGLIASEQLGSEMTSISQSIKNSERAGNIIATADAALGEVSSLLNDVRNLVQSSANKGAISADEIAANQVQVDNALDAITRISQTTVFGGQKLLNGTKSFSVSGSLGAFNSPTDIQINSFDPSLHTATANDDVSLTVTKEATKKTVTLKGTDFNTGTSNSLLDLSRGTSTSASTTVVTNDYSLANSTSSLNSLSTGSTRYQRVIEGGAGGIADLNGSGSDTVTLDVAGNIGTASITVNVAAVKADSSVLAAAINNVTNQTGVYASASASSGADITLKSTFVGTTGTTATLTATASTYAGAKSTRTLDGSAIATDITSTGSIIFSVVSQGGTDSITVNAEDIDSGQGGSLQNLVDAINNTSGVKVTAALSGTDIVLTSKTAGATGVTVSVTGGTASAGDKGAITTAVTNGSAVAGDAVTDVTTFNAGSTTATAATNGALNTKTTVFTITGNKGSADISTAQLSSGGLTGNDVIINNDTANNNGLQAFVDLINTRTDSTGVVASIDGANNLKLTSQGVGSTSVASISVAASGADQTLINSTSTTTTTAGTNGTSNTTTLELIGDKGRSVITFNNDAVINDAAVLRNAINAVTDQTGLVASGSGFGSSVTLSASKYGSAGTVTVNALAASNSADISLLNNAGSRVTVAGNDATGTITHSKGGGTFTASGELLTYTDNAISLNATLDPVLTPAVRATTTISHAAVNSGGLGSLGSSTTDTIDLQITGTVNGAQVTTNLTGLSVYQLKNDSRYLVDKINATSTTSGVQASTTGASGNIVLSATVAGSAGSVGITATAATTAGDKTAFNQADTFSGTVAGSDPAVASNFDVTGGALFQIGPTVNFTNQVNVNITSLDLTTLGRNYTTTGNNALSSLKTGGANSLDKANLTDAASIVDQAISQVATLRGKLGAIQKNAIDSNIRSLQTSLEQVTSAQSSIKDADFAVETAALTRSQILVQAGTSVLALANQSPQNVLSLLQR